MCIFPNLVIVPNRKISRAHVEFLFMLGQQELRSFVAGLDARDGQLRGSWLEMCSSKARGVVGRDRF